ncbi:hypothetical protein G6F31_012515 [Rhizopus arrhizus]|nr:hypothetical protein G6F31_012515 [Rhizopus arrhizus]
MEGGDDHRHPPLQAQLCQFVVDRPMRDAAPRDGDVVAGGKPFGGDIAVEQRMILARCAQQGRGEQVLHLGFLRMLAGSADIQVDPALHHRVIVGIAFGHEPQRAAWRVLAEHVPQAAAVAADEHVVGADAEGTFQGLDVHLAPFVEHPMGLLDHVAHLLAQFQRAWGRRQAAAGADPPRVAQRVAAPPQGAAHGRRAQIHAPSRSGDAAFVQQDIQGQQQVEIGQGHGSLQ